MCVPVIEFCQSSAIFSFCCPNNTRSHRLWIESSKVKKFYRDPSSFFSPRQNLRPFCPFFLGYCVLRVEKGIHMYAFSFFRISCVVTSSGNESFSYFFTSIFKFSCSLITCSWIYVITWGKTWASGVPKWRAIWIPLENRTKFTSRSNRKILSQKLIFRYGLSNRKIKIFTLWAL